MILTQPMKVKARERALVEAFTDRFPKLRNSASACPSVCQHVTQSRQSRACLLDYLVCDVVVQHACSSFLENNLEVSQSNE